MAIAILELGEGEFQVLKNGKLFLRTVGGDDPLDMDPGFDFDLYVRAAVAKWGLRRVLDDDGLLGVEVGDAIPKTKDKVLPDGEIVAILDE